MSYQNLLVETDDGACTIRIKRPDKLNALNRQTMEELGAFSALRIEAGWEVRSGQFGVVAVLSPGCWPIL